MRRTACILFGLHLFAAGAASGQARPEVRDVVEIQARVLEGLGVSTGRSTMTLAEERVAGLILPQNLQTMPLLTDMADLSRSLADAWPKQPGVVVTVVVVGPDGTVVGGGGGQVGSQVGGTVLRDAGGYYFYVNVAACNV